MATHTGLTRSPYDNTNEHMTSFSLTSTSWVVDSGARYHMTSLHLELKSYKPSVHGNIRIADGSYLEVMSKDSVNVFPSGVPTTDAIDLDLPISLCKGKRSCITHHPIQDFIL